MFRLSLLGGTNRQIANGWNERVSCCRKPVCVDWWPVYDVMDGWSGVPTPPNSKHPSWSIYLCCLRMFRPTWAWRDVFAGIKRWKAFVQSSFMPTWRLNEFKFVTHRTQHDLFEDYRFNSSRVNVAISWFLLVLLECLFHLFVIAVPNQTFENRSWRN